MKKYITLLLSILFLIFSLNAHAKFNGMIQSEDGSPLQIQMGTPINGKLSLWPLDATIAERVSSMIRGKSFAGFNIVEINYIGTAQGDPQVLEFEFEGFPVITGRSPVKPENLFGSTANIEWDSIIVSETGQIQKAIVFDSELEYEKDYTQVYIIIGCSIFVLLVFFLLLRRRKTKKIQVQLTNWDDVFYEAKTRQDFEKIYLRRREWLKEVGIETADIHDFFKILNSVQYKKEWSDVDFHEVSASFENIKFLFKK